MSLTGFCPAVADSLDGHFVAPAELANDFGTYRSPLQFADGRQVQTAAQWPERRKELESFWHEALGPWPKLLVRPAFSILRSEHREDFIQHRVRLEIASGRFEEGWLLMPATGRNVSRGVRSPAVLIPFYEPETSIGLKGQNRDFAAQLTRRGFITLSIGSPGGDARKPEPEPASGPNPATRATSSVPWQPLSYLAYVAANAHTALAQRPEVDANRIGIVGHSYGGKWALFAGALYEKFACVVVSDPGIVWDEARPNVNYWEPWYLGRDVTQTRKPGVITADNPRTGAYRRLIESGHDLTEIHALIAPRPFLVSGGAEDPPGRWRALNHLVAINNVLGVSNRVAMTNRATHDPNPESNAQLCAFFERFLGQTIAKTNSPKP